MGNEVRESSFVVTQKTLTGGLHEDFLLIWLDPNCRKNEDNDDTEKQLRSIDNSLQVHFTIEQSLDFIREVNPQSVFIIICGSYGEYVIDQIDQHSSVAFVYVFCRDKPKHERWAMNYEKIGKRIFDKKDDLFYQLEQDIQRYIRDILPISILRSDVNQKSFRELKEGGALFIWFQLLIEKLIHLPHTATAMKDLVDICRAQYRERENKLIVEFEKDYCAAMASKWYSKDSFLYRQLNKGLRTENFDILYKFRLFIADFHKQISELGFDNLKAKADEDNILTVYRGQLIPNDELQSIKTSKYGYIAMNTFLSTSLSFAVAAVFQGDGAQRPLFESVVFEIKINFSTLTSSTVPFALISHLSTTKDEEEVVFSIGSVFRIDSIDDDMDPIWYIKLTLDSKQSTGLNDLFDFYAQKENLVPTSLLDLSDVFLLVDDYERAEKYNNILLEQISADDVNVPKIYNNLGDICRLRGSFTQAENYLNLADEPQWKNIMSDLTLCDIHVSRGLLDDMKGSYESARRKLFEASSMIKQSSVKNAQILKHVGLTYKHEGKYEQSIFYYDQAVEIQKTLLPLQHPALVDTYDSLASIYTERLEFERAMKMHEEVLNIQKKILPPVHSAVAHTYSNIAWIYYNQNNIDAALDNYEIAMKMIQQIYGSDYRGLGTIFTNIGDVHVKKLDYDSAESYYRMALEIHQKYLSSSQIDLALTNNSMGNLRRNRYQFNEVVWYYQKALEILSLPEHINEYRKRAQIYHDYGQYYNMINENNQTIDYYKKSLKELELLYEDNTYQPSIVMMHITLGDTYKNTHDFQNSMAHYTKSFRLLTKLDKTTSDQKQRSNRSLGHFAYARKDYYNAFLLYEKSANLDRSFHHLCKRYINEIYAGITDVLLTQNQINEAIQMYNKMINFEQIDSSSDEHFLAILHFKLAKLYYRTSEYENALTSFEFVLKKEREKTESDRSMLADLLFRRGTTLTYLKKYDEALNSHRESLEYRALEDELNLASTYHEISVVLTAQGKYKDSVSYLIKSADIKERILAVQDSIQRESNCSAQSSIITIDISDLSLPKKDSSLQLHEDLLITQFNLAGLYQHLGQDNEALCEYRKVFKFCIQHPTLKPQIAAYACMNVSTLYNDCSQMQTSHQVLSNNSDNDIRSVINCSQTGNDLEILEKLNNDLQKIEKSLSNDNQVLVNIFSLMEKAFQRIANIFSAFNLSNQ